MRPGKSARLADLWKHPREETLTQQIGAGAYLRPCKTTPIPHLPLYPRFQLLQCPDHLRFCVPALRHTRFPFLSQKSYLALCGNRRAGHFRKERERMGHPQFVLRMEGWVTQPRSCSGKASLGLFLLCQIFIAAGLTILSQFSMRRSEHFVFIRRGRTGRARLKTQNELSPSRVKVF
jgi:hypothetical protein